MMLYVIYIYINYVYFNIVNLVN